MEFEYRLGLLEFLKLSCDVTIILS